LTKFFKQYIMLSIALTGRSKQKRMPRELSAGARKRESFAQIHPRAARLKIAVGCAVCVR